LLSAIVLLMPAAAGATVVNVVQIDYDDNDASSSITSGDVVHIKAVSSALLSSMDFSLEVTGPGLLQEATSKAGFQHDLSFGAWSQPDPLIVNNAIAQLSGISFSLTPVDLFWNLDVACTGPGQINVDLQINGTSTYRNNPGDPFVTMTDDDLGDLQIDVLATGPTYILTTVVSGGNGTIAPATGQEYAQGTQVALTATPDAGYRVKSWSGADTKSSRLNTNTVTMTKKKKVTVKFEPIPADNIRKALFGADKTREDPNSINDSFIIMGTLSATQQDVIDTENVTVRLSGPGAANLFEETLSTTDDNFSLLSKNMGFKYKGSCGSVTKLSFNIKKGVFSLRACGLDLTGLSSLDAQDPVTLEIAFGSYQHTFDLHEDIINGAKKYLPIKYLSGHSDAIRVEKRSIREKNGLISGTVKGAIALGTGNVELIPEVEGATVIISWNGTPLIIPADGGVITGKNAKYTYKRPRGATEADVISKALFDMRKGTFSITIKNAALTSQGDVEFSVEVISQSQTVFFQSDTFTIPAG